MEEDTINRAFNTYGWENFADPLYQGVPGDLFYSGPAGSSQTVVEQLISEVGLRPVRVGDADRRTWLIVSYPSGLLSRTARAPVIWRSSFSHAKSRLRFCVLLLLCTARSGEAKGLNTGVPPVQARERLVKRSGGKRGRHGSRIYRDSWCPREQSQGCLAAAAQAQNHHVYRCIWFGEVLNGV